MGPLSGETTLTHSASLSLKYEVSLACAQRIQAGLLRTRGCGVEARQLEDHPRAFVHLRQPEGHGRHLRGHLDFGTGAYVAAGYRVVLAVTAENDGLLSSSTAAPAAPPLAAPGAPPEHHRGRQQHQAHHPEQRPRPAAAPGAPRRSTTTAARHHQAHRQEERRHDHHRHRQRQHSGARHRPCTPQRSRWA